MSDDRLQGHIATWMQTLAVPATVELRCRAEIVDSVVIADGEAAFSQLAADLLESSATDAADEGKTRVYELVGIDANSERYICPLRIRRRIDKTAGELLASLARQNAELHSQLVRKDKDAAELLLRFVQTLSDDRRRLVDENTEHRKRAGETIDKLESLRSQAFERDLVLEKHRADIDVRERLTDAAVPLAMAIAGKLTSGTVPSDLPNSTYAEVVKSLSESQLEAIAGILGECWNQFDESFSAALSGRPDVKAFRGLVGSLTRDKQMALVSTLNMGQRAAIEVILNGDN